MAKWSKSVVMFTDGASRGNPGPASIGVLFTTEKGEEIDSISEAIGIQTNNFAEYFAVIEGFRAAIKHKVTHIHLKSDSEFLIKQLKGEYKVKSETILPLFTEAKNLLKKFEGVKLEHVRREKNKEADALANEALDSGKEPMEFKITSSGGSRQQTSLELEPVAVTAPRLQVEVEIVPMVEEYLGEYRDVLESVAREGEFICFTEVPPLERSEKFFKHIESTKGCFFVAKVGKKIVGWADINRGEEPRFSHRGTLGMGILKDYRGKGIGRKLLEGCVQDAEEKGFEQINLSVFGSNLAAIALYRKFGFRVDGVKKKASKYRGQYSDFVLMTLEI